MHPGPYASTGRCLPCPETLASLCRYFNQPKEVKAKYPSVDWGAVKLLGYEVNKMHEGGMGLLPSCLHTLHCYRFNAI